MTTATFIRDLPSHRGTQKLWLLSEPLENGTLYVVSSAVSVPFSGPETYLFPANENGEITDWGELDGSFRGSENHELAIANAGWEVCFAD